MKPDRLFDNVFTNARLYRPGPPIPAVLKNGVSDNQSKMYAEQLTSGVNQLIGMDCFVHCASDTFVFATVKFQRCTWYAGFARRLVQGDDVVLSVEVSAAGFKIGT